MAVAIPAEPPEGRNLFRNCQTIFFIIGTQKWFPYSTEGGEDGGYYGGAEV
jgi:hypothetical protein